MKGFRVIGFLLCILFQVQVANAGHYTSVYSGNPFNPMSILVTGVLVDDVNLDIGDEIGIFDGDVCVGSASFQGDNIIGISVSMADPTSIEVDGFKQGNRIYFRIWKQKTNFEYINVNTNFNLSFDTVFNALGTAIVSLDAFLKQQMSKILLDQVFSVTENALQNTVVGKVQVDLLQGDLGFKLLEDGQPSPFKLDSSGLILVENSGLLNYDENKSYKLTIRVYSKQNDELSDTSMCTVNIVRIPPSISEIRNDTAFVGLVYKKVMSIKNATSKALFVIPKDVPSWLTIRLQDNNEITIEGIPGNLDVGENKISFSLSDETNNIQQSYLLETIEENKKPDIVLSSNPTNGPFTILVNQLKGNTIDLSVRRLDGSIVYRNVLENMGGSLTLPIDLSGNVKSIYLVEVKYDNNIITKKLILQ